MFISIAWSRNDARKTYSLDACDFVCRTFADRDRGGCRWRFMTGTSNVGLTAFLCFLPMCFFHLGIVLKNLRDENHELKLKLDKILLVDGDRR